MDPTKGILVKTFGNIADADLAAGHLRSHGIECVIKTDDCAGMYPPMGVIQLLVDPAYAEDSSRILKEEKVIPNPAETLLPEKPLMSGDVPPPRVLRFNSGLIIGVIVGALLHFSYESYQKYRDGNDWFDKDGDGLPEEERIWRGGENIEGRLDRNGDSRIDAWFYYQKGKALRDEVDDNFDGRVDGWVTYLPNGLFSHVEFDTDHNGIRDLKLSYSNGIPKQFDWRPNGTNVISLRQLYRHGVLDEELRDLNGDGWFDMSINYDPFNTPIRTNNLRPTTQSP